MNTCIPTLTLALLGLAYLGPCQAAESDPESPGVVQKVERAVQHGAEAAASGVQRGAKAAARGVEHAASATATGVGRGVRAAASGVARGASAAARGIDSAASKVTGNAASSPSQ